MLIAMCLIITVLISYACKHGSEISPSDRDVKKRNQAGMRLDTLLCNRDFDRALLFMDTLHAQYPRDPQFYFCEGWIYAMKGDSAKARACFTEAIAIYDSLIAVKNDLGDQINRAFIIQILYGREAYDKCLDDILQTLKNPHDSVYIEVNRKLDCCELDDLFKPDMLKTFPDSITQTD